MKLHGTLHHSRFLPISMRCKGNHRRHLAKVLGPLQDGLTQAILDTCCLLSRVMASIQRRPDGTRPERGRTTRVSGAALQDPPDDEHEHVDVPRVSEPNGRKPSTAVGCTQSFSCEGCRKKIGHMVQTSIENASRQKK